MHKPDIQTAVPQRRYQLGEYSVVVLGEIESGDTIDYRYILAAVKDGQGEPGLYITSERSTDPNQPGSHAMRVILADGAEVISTSNDWADIESFSTAGLEGVVQMLNLTDEEPQRLL